MPINIYKEETIEKVAYLCKNNWDLPSQINELEKWLANEAGALPADKYIADIGFDIRPAANGGGATLSSDSMKIMANKGIDLYFSEYPNQLNLQ